ncbi:Glucan 1,3-beta-glucosidase [Mycena venus]|uniref:Glucan 1,3-beta-glucosidase n=1 Tax=Mycena venus TaxID=2733690 RepID=A0A8H6Y8J9_9AGAR|nr:Glucan 1,3-beta-glucosidase [Mycena venus]
MGQTCSGVVPSASASDPFWMGNGGLHSLGRSAYNPNPGYKVWRNVKADYGAVGNGIADDTDAINRAISDGGRCGQGCHSSTTTPAVVYFPGGTYRVTKPIVPFYFTSLVGDFKNKPILKADANFVGVAVIDADPYVLGQSNPDGSGVNWWVNQNNFFRSVRNFVIDATAMSPTTKATGIHWQVGQATSIINVDIKLVRATDNPSTQHQGIFAENGYGMLCVDKRSFDLDACLIRSGGFMSDITIDGGAFGMWISNQQITIRNIQISNAATAIFEQWNWGFTWWNINIHNCLVGFDIHTGGLTLDTQSAGGVLIVDSWISNVVIGIRMSSSQPSSLAGSVIMDNVQFSNIFGANIQDQSGVVLGPSADYGQQWFQGKYKHGLLRKKYSNLFYRPASLVNGFAAYFSRSRPQYQDYEDVQFQTVRDLGKAAGDGVTDDTAAINAFISQWSGCYVLFFEAGTYRVTDTIFVPPGTIIVGEMFSTIMGTGPNFADQNNPRPVIRVGNPGDRGVVEISDMVITTTGGSAGAIGIEWNIEESSQGSAGMWDVHVRLGGAKGTNIDAANCPISSTALKCTSAFLGIHITDSGSGYFENVWVWNADHDLDDPAETKINSFSGRGILVESTGPVWLVGTASEHHVIYQYAFNHARDVWAGLMQTETPYFQPTPAPPSPFSINPDYGDPVGALSDAWGVVITLSSNLFIYGAGLYSFFQTYSQACVPTRNCQNSMVLIDQDSASIYIYQLTTAGSTNMISYPNASIARQADNINGFASTVTFWEAPQTVPQGECGVTRREVEPYDRHSVLELMARQSEVPQDYNFYAGNPAAIDTDLMVGLKDNTGKRRPRPNCIFYVNQKNVTENDPNYAKNRAIEFARLMNAQNPARDFHTLYDVYNNAEAFSWTEGPMFSANRDDHLRDWFSLTSAEYAKLCFGKLWLVVEEYPRDIWAKSIWMTHEARAVNETRMVTQIVEIRPSEIGLAVAEFDFRFIDEYNYRYPQPPGATPPRDTDRLEIDACAQIDSAKALAQWAAYPDVSGDTPPYNDFGGCTMHIQQWDNDESGGGGPFDPPSGSPKSYSVEITIWDNARAHKIGFLPRTNAPLQMASKIDSLLGVDPGTSDGPIQLTLGDQKWNTGDGSCSVGDWDGGPGNRNRNMDCGFSCPWNGGDSTDHTPFGLWYA